MRTTGRCLIIMAVCFLVSAVSFADRPQCPSQSNGVCFINLEGVPEGGALITEEGDAAAVLWEGTRDEVFRYLPDGTMVWHGSGRGDWPIFACRAEDGGIDCILDYLFNGGSPAGIMVGTGHGAWNINWECQPFMTSLIGTVTDTAGQVFSITVFGVKKPNPAGGDCISLVDSMNLRLQRD